MNSRFKQLVKIEKSVKRLIYTYRRKWFPLFLASLFVFFSFFPIPFPHVFLATTSNKISLPSLIEPVSAQATPALCAVPGKDGVGAPPGVINTYYPGVGTATAGATSIPVGAIDINGASTAISTGDLLLIIQMQDATINSTNTDAYGDGIGGDVPPLVVGGMQPINGASGFTGGTAGRYEYVVATGPVAAGSVPIRGTNGSGLINSYFSSAETATQGKQTYQVVRVPQYSSATLGSATSSYWNGNTGGIVAYDVAGNLNLTGSINVNGRGFRGGGGRQLAGATSPNDDYVTLSTLDKNGSKGEGIAGTPRYVINQNTLSLVDNTTEGYPNGSYGRGAPGNAGGGSTDGNSFGNDQNSGGGGGSNGGSGGIGGRSWDSNLPTGGFGGALFPATTNLLVLGGGGGAGTTNDGTFASSPDPSSPGLYSSGASGGGLVMLRTNTVSNAGTINANGSTALDVGNDSAGGGGAGGSVLVSALSNNLTGLTVNVRGGNGGNTDGRGSGPHGPGGGGGGGVVVANANSGVTTDVQGGIPGFTDNMNRFGAEAGDGLLAFPLPVGAIPGASSGAACVPALTVVKTNTSTPTTNPGGTAIYAITVSNGAGLATANNVVINDNSLPAGFTLAAAPAPTITLAGGATSPSTSAPTAGASNLSWGTFSIPGGGSVQIQFTVNVGAGVANGTYNNPASATYDDPATGGTRTVPYIDNTGEDVQVTSSFLPNLNLVKRITAINNIPITGFVDGTDTATSNDNSINWPTGNTQYLRGAIDCSTASPCNGISSVAPGGLIEYTIYFLSNGVRPASNVQLCDRIPANTIFQPDTYGSGNGILLGWNTTGGALPLPDPAPDPANSTIGTDKVALSNVSDADPGQFLATNVSVTNSPAPCDNGATNPDGAILVRLGAANVPFATGAGTPTNSYGFVRFAVRVR